MQHEAIGALPRSLKVLWVEILLLSLVSLLFLQVEKFRKVPPLFYWPLSPPGMSFGDFTIYLPKFQQLFHTIRFFHLYFPFTYPAPVALVYEVFVRLFPADPQGAFVTASVAALLLPWGLVLVALRKAGMTATVAVLLPLTLIVCSWPMLLIFDRGNMEICVWLALVFAAWAFVRTHLKLAAAFLGLAGALKLFPIILLGLFISMRRWRELAIGVAVFGLVTVASLAILGPTIPIAYRGIAEGLDFFRTFYMQRWMWWENGVDHSLFALVKSLMISWFGHDKTVPFPVALNVYLYATAIGGCLLYLLRIRLLPLLNQWMIFCVISIYFTAFSGDGTLIHLYYPLVFLLLFAIGAQRRGVRVPGVAAALYLLGFLVSYESFFQLHFQRHEGQAKAVALGALLWIALRYPFAPFPWMGGDAPDEPGLGRSREEVLHYPTAAA